jgi:hypothetical protein
MIKTDRNSKKLADGLSNYLFYIQDLTLNNFYKSLLDKEAMDSTSSNWVNKSKCLDEVVFAMKKRDNLFRVLEVVVNKVNLA